MARAQTHRGPDGRGYAVWDDAPPFGAVTTWYGRSGDAPAIAERGFRLGLLHNLLAIQDDAHRSRQPMTCRDGRYWISYNGEIYNFPELRAELAASGVTFRTGTDTEVLLALWAARGPAALPALRGMFAFAVYDARLDVLWAARDRFGIKPLYWAPLSGDSGIVLASELRALHASGLVPRTWHVDAVRAFLAAGVNAPGETTTFFDGVSEVAAGTVMTIRPGAVHSERYYTLPDVGTCAVTEEALPVVRERFVDTVGLHLRSAREVGICLSGGLDSSNIAHAATALHESAGAPPAQGFTIAAPDSTDGRLAGVVAAGTGLRHQMVPAAPTVALRDLVEMVIACETPNHTAGPINQFALLRHVRSRHVRVLLNGHGADESLSAYPWFVPVVADFMRARGSATGALALEDAYARRDVMAPAILAAVQRMYRSRREWIFELDGGATAVLGVSAQEVAEWEPVQYYVNDDLDWAGMRRQQLLRREVRHVLRHEDRLAMWFGIESRVPFLDHELVELFGALTPDFLFKDGYAKYPLRVLFPAVPASVRWETRKTGYWHRHSRIPDLTALTARLAPASSPLQAVMRYPDRLSRTVPDTAWRFFQIALLSEDLAVQDIDRWVADADRASVVAVGRELTRDADVDPPVPAPAASGMGYRGTLLRASKRFTDGTHRTADPAETLDRIRPHLRTAGITRLADVTGLDRIGIPTALAYRPNAITLSSSAGKGFTLEAALVSAAMEGIEVYHGETLRMPVTRASYADLAERGPVIPRERLLLAQHSLFNERRPEFWVEAWDIIAQHPVPVPFDAVGMASHPAQRPHLWLPFAMNSNGLASGNHLIEAICAALLEVIERDAMSCHLHARRVTGRASPRVCLDTVPHARVRELLDRFDAACVGVVIYDLTIDTNVPTYTASIYDRLRRHHGVYAGSGAHLDPEIAMIRALTEAAQSRLTYIAGSRDDYFRHDYLKHRMSDSDQGVAALVATPETVDARHRTSRATDSFEGDVAVLLADLRRCGLPRVLVADLTQDEIGIPVVRVLVPGLEGYPSARFNPPRARAQAFATAALERAS
jgi:asparagine synthase (glutamine-hydrolysing)